MGLHSYSGTIWGVPPVKNRGSEISDELMRLAAGIETQLSLIPGTLRPSRTANLYSFSDPSNEVALYIIGSLTEDRLELTLEYQGEYSDLGEEIVLGDFTLRKLNTRQDSSGS